MQITRLFYKNRTLPGKHFPSVAERGAVVGRGFKRRMDAARPNDWQGSAEFPQA